MDAEKRRDPYGHTVLCPSARQNSYLSLLSLGIADNTLPAGENPAGVFLFILFPSVGSQFRKEDDNLEALSPLGSCFQMKI